MKNRPPAFRRAASVAVMLSAGAYGCSSEREVEAPLNLSCGSTLPKNWESGDVVNLLSNQSASLTNESLRRRGSALLIGKWEKSDLGYVIKWNGVVKSSGALQPFPEPKPMTVRFFATGKTVGVDRVIEIRSSTAAALQCLVGQ